MHRGSQRPQCLILLVVLGGGFVVAPSLPALGDPRVEASYRILAGPYPKKTRPDAGVTTSTFNLKGVTISVEFLEPAARAAFVRTIAPAAPDPFAVPPGRPEVYHAVRVGFDNDSTADVVFQAGNVIVYTDGKTQEFGIDLTDLYRVAAGAGVEDPQAMIDRVAPLIYDSSTTIPKGRKTERLLLFGPLQGKWREIQMIFSFLQIGAETHTVSFTFHKQTSKG
ncbi:MAG TPA: hypothetical protein VEO94_07340 [Candidatus Dormibacteraeota bacterium]|nr:hypothetical protein [Candidatus Dormibacteraeota bacterium]